jgi:hypothetical protein
MSVHGPGPQRPVRATAQHTSPPHSVPHVPARSLTPICAFLWYCARRTLLSKITRLGDDSLTQEYWDLLKELFNNPVAKSTIDNIASVMMGEGVVLYGQLFCLDKQVLKKKFEDSDPPIPANWLETIEKTSKREFNTAKGPFAVSSETVAAALRVQPAAPKFVNAGALPDSCPRHCTRRARAHAYGTPPGR